MHRFLLALLKVSYGADRFWAPLFQCWERLEPQPRAAPKKSTNGSFSEHSSRRRRNLAHPISGRRGRDLAAAKSAPRDRRSAGCDRAQGSRVSSDTVLAQFKRRGSVISAAIYESA